MILSMHNETYNYLKSCFVSFTQKDSSYFSKKGTSPALKVIQHMLATHFPVNTSTTIYPSQPVTLNDQGEIILANNTTPFIGIAGDHHRPISNFANKAWELGSDVSYSDKITVYSGHGGRFIINSCVIAEDKFFPGETLYTSPVSGILTTSGHAGGDSVAKILNIISQQDLSSGILSSGIPNINVPVDNELYLLIQLLQ